MTTKSTRQSLELELADAASSQRPSFTLSPSSPDALDEDTFDVGQLELSAMKVVEPLRFGRRERMSGEEAHASSSWGRELVCLLWFGHHCCASLDLVPARWKELMLNELVKHTLSEADSEAGDRQGSSRSEGLAAGSRERLRVVPIASAPVKQLASFMEMFQELDNEPEIWDSADVAAADDFDSGIYISDSEGYDEEISLVEELSLADEIVEPATHPPLPPPVRVTVDEDVPSAGPPSVQLFADESHDNLPALSERARVKLPPPPTFGVFSGDIPSFGAERASRMRPKFVSGASSTEKQPLPVLDSASNVFDQPTKQVAGVNLLLNGRYQLASQIGEGGFATVYRGLDIVTGKDVAIKMIKPALVASQDSEEFGFVERFEHEADLATRLDHPNIVRVYDYGHGDALGHERPYMIMELLDGVGLHEIIAKGPIAPAHALDLLCQALDGLSHIHSHDITHKDLKPSNLFICKTDEGDDRLYIMDFGAAHDARKIGGRMTISGSLTGTVRYLAPEYVLAQKITPAVDVYQMGIVFAEMLLGDSFIDNTTNLIGMVELHLKRGIDLPEVLSRGRLGEILRKAVARDPLKRYATAEEFKQALLTLTPADFPDEIMIESMRGQLHHRSIFSSLSDLSGDLFGFLGSPFKNKRMEALDEARRNAESAEIVHSLSRPRESEAPTSDRRSLSLVVGLCVLTIIAVAAIKFWPSGEPVVEPTEKGAIATGAVADGRTAGTHVWTINSTPAGADLFLDGRKLGKTPYTIEVVEDKEILRLLALEAPGYHRREISIAPDRSHALAIELNPVSEAMIPAEVIDGGGTTPSALPAPAEPKKDPAPTAQPIKKDPVAPPVEETPRDPEPVIKPTPAEKKVDFVPADSLFETREVKVFDDTKPEKKSKKTSAPKKPRITLPPID